MKKHRQKLLSAEVKAELRQVLQHIRLVVLSGPLGSDFERWANEVAEELWPEHLCTAAVHLSVVPRAAHGVVLHQVERLLGAKDRRAFFNLVNSPQTLLMTCDRDWLAEVQRVLLDDRAAVVSLPEVVELPYVRDLSARLSETQPLSAREFRRLLRLKAPTLGRALAHPLIVKWSLMGWLDEQYRSHSRCIRIVTAEQSLTFHFRRALRGWVEEIVASDLEESVRLFLACMRDKRIRPVVRYDVLTVLFDSPAFPAILDNTRSDLFSNHRGLLKETFEFIEQRRVTTAPLVALIRFLDRNKALFDSYDHRWVLDILHFWFQGVTDENPYPDGSEEVASLAREWLDHFNPYELHVPYKECLKLLARIPSHSRTLLEEIASESRSLSEAVKEEPSLVPILERDLPELNLVRAKPTEPEDCPEPPPEISVRFSPPESLKAHALVKWARHRLVEGKDGDRTWQSALREATDLDSHDSITQVGVRLVAALCARHHWSEVGRSEREWILDQLEESLLQSFDDWSESNQAQKFYYSPDRQATRAVVHLLSRLRDDFQPVLLELLPYGLLHPAEEVRRYTALALGAHRRELDPDLITRCAWVMIEEDNLRRTTDRHTLSWDLCKTFSQRSIEPEIARAALYRETRLRLNLLANSDGRDPETEFEIDSYFAELENELSIPEVLDPSPMDHG